MGKEKVKSPTKTSLIIMKSSDVRENSKKLPRYVQNVADYSFEFSIPQQRIDILSSRIKKYEKELKVLSSLTRSQMITFRESSVRKLNTQIDDQCLLVYSNMTDFFNKYCRMCSYYFYDKINMTNAKETEKLFASWESCCKNFENLIKKIKDKSLKEKWQKNVQLIDRKAEISDTKGWKNNQIYKKIKDNIITPIVECATAIKEKELELKNKVSVSQYALEAEVMNLKSFRNKANERFPKMLEICISKSELTLEELEKEKEKAKKKKNNKLLDQISELESKSQEILDKAKFVETLLNSLMHKADEAIKKTKYGAEKNVSILIDLKSALKKMVNYAQEVFVTMQNASADDNKRESTVDSTVQNISNIKNYIIKTKKIKFDTTKVNSTQTKQIRGQLDEASIKFAKLNTSSKVRDLEKVVMEWNKAKPNFLIAFFTKYKDWIWMALGVISSILM